MEATEASRALLDDVLARYEHSPSSPRVRTITEALVRHLHAFVVEVGLSREEWMAGIQFLTATGRICDEARQEFILLSDTLGVSTLVEQIGYGAGGGATANTVLGPFYVPGSPTRERGSSILMDDDPGERVVLRGNVTDVDGRTVANASLDVWQNASNGFYACQQPGVQHPENLRGVFTTDVDGTYELRSLRPSPYPIPDDGPAGHLLKVHGRGWMRPAHIHFLVTAPGYKTLVTHVFDASSPHLDDDAVFGVQPELVRTFAPDAGGELSTVFDIVLTPDG